MYIQIYLFKGARLFISAFQNPSKAKPDMIHEPNWKKFAFRISPTLDSGIFHPDLMCRKGLLWCSLEDAFTLDENRAPMYQSDGQKTFKARMRLIIFVSGC
ncbi:hypothetical protein AMECASPLE_034602 [Ameca splendens]|uniref:Uncharacterized protein n=1 Tax=Ameca splendens TaxID=208324 RepID=A0ABV1A3I8_9TELE